MTHSPTPWKAGERGDLLADGQNNPLAQFWKYKPAETLPNLPAAENVKRTVECVNACEGLENLEGVNLKELLHDLMDFADNYCNDLAYDILDSQDEETQQNLEELQDKVYVTWKRAYNLIFGKSL